MTDLELVTRQIQECPTIRLPLTGIVVDLTEPMEVAQALQDIRDLKRDLDDVRGLLEGVLRLEAQHQGTKTLHLDRMDAVVSGGQRVEYDVIVLQQGLLDAGLPEGRAMDAVTPIITYKVNAAVLRQLAAANPAYKTAIDDARTTVEVPWRVTIKPREQP